MGASLCERDGGYCHEVYLILVDSPETGILNPAAN